jgi:hypothetical protein
MQSRDAAQRSTKCMNQIPLPDSARAEHPEADEVRDDKTRQIAADVAYRQIAIVNVIFLTTWRRRRPMGADRRRRHWIRICDTLLSTGEIWADRPPICDYSHARAF